MSIQPQGEDLRKAVKWISEQRQEDPKKSLSRLTETACKKFDLSPKDAEFLGRWFSRSKEPEDRSQKSE